MALGIRYKDQKNIFREKEGETPFLSFRLLEDTKTVKHGFSTRLGGVSEGYYASLNLSFTRGDEETCVRENFRRIAGAIGVSCEDMVLSRQTHTTNVRKVTESDRGSGILYPASYTDVDGLITDIPGICLVTSFADCVPLYFVDPVRKAIGLTHSGWRGTVGKIGKITVEKMQKEFGSDPKDIVAAVGPSICQDCYEVSEDVIERIRQNFDPSLWEKFFYRKPNGHYQLDLWKMNEEIFLEAVLLPEHIAVTNACTHCNPKVFYSHRAMGEQRGNLCAFLALKE